MNTFLACAGIDGNKSSIEKLLKYANSKKPDTVLVAGGINRIGANRSQKMNFLKECFQDLGQSGHRIILIPGPYDTPLGEFLRAAMNAEITYPNLFFAHATTFSNANVAVDGIGGKITENEDSTDPTLKYSHNSAEFLFRRLWYIRKSVKILMFSEPPPGKLSGNGGNSLVEEFIKTYHPAICIVAGNTQYRGYEREKHGFTVNPGKLSDGSAAWIDWLKRSVQILDLQ
jgi:Icc-related predicted phosphoesterase